MPDDLNAQARAANAEIREDMALDQRDAAIHVAAAESVRRDAAEAEAIDARIEANQAAARARELDTDRRVLSTELAYERDAASGNAFGMFLALGLLAAVIIVGVL